MDTVDDSPTEELNGYHVAHDAGPGDLAFDGSWELSQHIPGWLSRDQAALLFHEVRSLPPHSTVVEIGSHFGRSTTVLASARPDVEVVAIDPFTKNRKYPGSPARAELESNLSKRGLRDRVRVIEARSQRVRATWDQPIEMLWIDGKHDAWSALDDLRWAEHLPAGGSVLIHDAFSSLGVTIALYAQLLSRQRLRYERRVGSLAVLRKVPSGSRGAMRMVSQTPAWARNLTVKLALRLRMRWVARLFGHHDDVDPY